MMYRLKHYQGLLNLDRFTRIEKHDEERYKLIPRKNIGAAKSVSEIEIIPQIIFFTPEGYGGLQTSIEYDTPEKRDEDFELIVSLICVNKSQNFDIIKEQQELLHNYKEISEHATEVKTTIEQVKTFLDKTKIKLK